MEQAFEALEEHDVVWGPTPDGGYYLVGMKKPLPALFREIEWGSPNVLSCSLDIARLEGLSRALLEPLPDLDTLEDLRVFPDFAKGLDLPFKT
ncbi:MAG: DUF2064 domain-containing protein [bacterium]|nr:DUF2064 domain-containing protein [bacterium]